METEGSITRLYQDVLIGKILNGKRHVLLLLQVEPQCSHLCCPCWGKIGVDGYQHQIHHLLSLMEWVASHFESLMLQL